MATVPALSDLRIHHGYQACCRQGQRDCRSSFPCCHLAISGGIDFSVLAATQLVDPVNMAACWTEIIGLRLRTFLLDPITQLYYVMCLLVSHVPSYLSPSTTIFSPLFMVSATQAYRQPANWYPSSMFGMALVDRLENGPSHVILTNEPKSISIMVLHYPSTTSPYSISTT